MNYPKLKELRIENNLTQAQVAEFLRCHRLVYARYENGFREIPVSMIVELAKFYKVTTDYLLDLEK